MSKPALAAAVALLAFAAYANALGNGFVWDDPIILARQLPVFRGPGAVFFPPPNVPQFAPDYYRPLVIASYLADQALGGGQPAWFHLTVVLAHVLATLAVFAFGVQLFERMPGPAAVDGARAAALGAALFAVHPIHTEAVAWMAGRADVFATLFGVTAAYAHLRSRTHTVFAGVAAVSLLLAMLSKEVAASLIAVLPVLDLLVPDAPAPSPAVQPRSQRRRAAEAPAATRPAWLLRYGCLAAAVLAFAGLRLAAVTGGWNTTSGEERTFLPVAVLSALGVYAGRLLLPVGLNAYIAELPRDGLALGSSAAVVVAFAVALLLLLRRRSPVLAFLLSWMALTLAPALTILFKIPEVPAAERYLYLPSVGFCLLAGYGAARGLAANGVIRWATAGATGLVLVAGLVATVTRNRVWASDLVLWADTSAKSANAGMPFSSLGGALLRAGRVDEAERAYQEALRRSTPAHVRVTVLSNLGTIELGRGALEQAEALYRSSVAVRATPDAVYNLGVVQLRRADAAHAAGDEQLKRQRAAAALATLESAEKANPFDPDIPLAIGQALDLLDRKSEARTRYERALSLGLTGEVAARVRALIDQP